MATIIGEHKGYTILYDSGAREFKVQNAQREEVGHGATQEDVEKQADALSKSQFHFPIRAFHARDKSVTSIRITSVNLGEPSVWVVTEGKGQYGYRSRQKQSLTSSYSPLYERTEANEELVTSIEAKRETISQLETEIKELIAKLEKPIGPKYFGLER